MKKSMGKKLSIAGNIIFAAVILYLCYFIMASAYHKTPSFFGYRMLRVVTDSMEPVFGSGDCIIIKKTDPFQLTEGDIITFASDDPLLRGAYNTHRIYDKTEDYTTGETVYYTKGDNNNWTDEYTVTPDKIAGKYVGRLPFGKMLSSFFDKLSEKNFYFAVVIIPVLLLFISSMAELVKEIRRK